MEQIIRKITKNQGQKNELIYEFTTFDFILRYTPKEAFHENFNKLVEYVRAAFIYGMPSRPVTASQSKRLLLKCERLKGHAYSSAAAAASAKRGYTAHMTVQQYFMKNHPYAIAMELPVSDEEMTALLDLVLCDPVTGIIYVLDYKPDAVKEKSASTQVYHQKRLLCKNAAVDPSFVEAYYFDEKDTYKLIN